MNKSTCKKTKLERQRDFDAAPLSAYFDQKTMAAVVDCSEAKLERDRWAGTGLPFVKFGRNVRYRKGDCIKSLQPVHSTSEYGGEAVAS